jgi:translation elongation factor EF-G
MGEVLTDLTSRRRANVHDTDANKQKANANVDVPLIEMIGNIAYRFFF